MARRLETSDFRAVRYILEPEDFLLGPDEPDPSPSDPIEPRIWGGITTLPTDVAIRTSDHHGRLLKLLYDLWAAWLKAIGDPETPDQIFYPMLDAADDFRAATFNALHGFYRQSFDCLRSSLELVAIGAYCQVFNKPDDFQQWRAGQLELGLGRACDNLMRARVVRPLNTYLAALLNDSLFEQRGNTNGLQPGWARRLFADLSQYAHSRPGFTNGDMWQSNGPVYVPDSFIRTATMQFETYALCYSLVKLARANFSLPEDALQLFQSESVRPMKIAYATYSYLFGKRCGA